MPVGEAVLIPPILEIFVFWHPEDLAGERVTAALLEHFHGTAFAGLVGGAVEVYARSAAWDGSGGPPRPLPFMEPLPNGLASAAVTVVVPVLGTHLARSVERDGRWYSYVRHLVDARAANPGVAVFGLRVDKQAMEAGTRLADLFGTEQGLASGGATDHRLLCRDLAHSIAGFVGGSIGDRLQVFISHTKRNAPEEQPDRVFELVEHVREVIGQTHMTPYFDEADLQPGERWEETLTRTAQSSALLAVRTDLYASRDWCQREVLAAKRADMPVVVLHAMQDGEERGSFLMDHVPSVSLASTDLDEQRIAIELALNKTVDEALKRALWQQQRARLEDYGFDWLPANAPEPATLAGWLLTTERRPTPHDRHFVLHPDPPLETLRSG